MTRPSLLVMSQSTALGGMELGNMSRDVELLRAAGWGVSLALRVWPELRGWTRRLGDAGIQVHDYSPPLFLAGWDRWRTRRLRKRLGRLGFERVRREVQPHAAVCYSSSRLDCLAHLYYAREAGLPAVLSVHQVYAAAPFDDWRRRHLTHALSALRGVQCVSRAAADGFLAAFGDLLPPRVEPVVVHNGVDVDRFRPPSAEERARARSAVGISPDAPAIGTVCRLDPMKGVLHLLEAFLHVRARAPRAVLVVAGDGSQRQALIDAAAAAGVASAVRVLGYCEDVPAVLAALDVFASFSRIEGFGLATAEAMAAGLPVVATDVPGTREVVEAGQTGLLFPYGDWSAGGEALASLIGAPGRAAALGRAARARTEERWSIQQRDEAMRKFFELALGTPAALPMS